MMKKWYNKDMHKNKNRQGFTLVELSLSLVFIATLSIAVALIISNSIATYRRGLTLNSVNTVGMEVVDDVRAAIQNSPSRSVAEKCASVYDQSDFQYDYCVEDGGLNFALLEKEANVVIRGSERYNLPVFGAFCSGEYSYIWNSGYFFNNEGATVEDVARASFAYRGTDGRRQEVSDFRLLKIKDNQRAVCISKIVDDVKTYSYSDMRDNPDYSDTEATTLENMSSVFDISPEKYEVLSEEPVDVLADTGNLALYDFNIAHPVIGENSLFYSVSFILGTIQGGVNIMATDDYCVAPGDLVNNDYENFNYCAINKFNFAAQATGG